MRPSLTPKGVEQTRRQTCFCGHEYQQTLILVDGSTDLGGLVEKAREVWVPISCVRCTKAKIRAGSDAHGGRG